MNKLFTTKKMQKIMALMLCAMMLLPTQGMSVLAGSVGLNQINVADFAEEGERVEQTLPLEPIKDKEERIEETLPLNPIEKTGNREMAIYWNPGGSLPEDLATSSDGQVLELPSKATGSNAGKATSSNAAKGKDSADGRTAEHPVKTLKAALKRADQMMKEGADASEIVIYAMNPMEIGEGQLYVLNAANIPIVSWPERTYNNDTVFYINGGQLTLVNTTIKSGRQDADSDETELVRVRGGALQLGEEVQIDGRVVMDYQSEEDILWEKATHSDGATRSNASEVEKTEKVGFDISEYILNTDTDQWEIMEDSTRESTWRPSVIELIDGFAGVEGGYLLEIRENQSMDRVELVKTLYADADTEEEFLSQFRLADADEGSWRFQVESQKKATVRNTGAKTLSMFGRSAATKSVAMTMKTLAATRSSGIIVYWNPGPALIIDGTEYPAGEDGLYDGSTPFNPKKTLEKAMEKANGGTIVSMRTLTLNEDAKEYLGERQPDGSYLLKSPSSNAIVSLRVWESYPHPVLRVPEGETLRLQDIILEGVVKDGVMGSAQSIISQGMAGGTGGDIIIQENVTAETGYIQLTASPDLKNHPVQVTSAEGGQIKLFVGGINENLDYRYTDVVVPAEALATEAEADPEAVGGRLLSRFSLEKSNRTEEHGGSSQFDWCLRQDTTEDDGVARRQNLELYADYYFDAVYLDGVRGSDSNHGANCHYPVRTWAKVREIWETQMRRSIEARELAFQNGHNADYINRVYPMPTKIYICQTVEVSDIQVWDLQTFTDYDNSTIITEVISHTEIPDKEDGSGAVHELAKALVKVTGSGVLTLKNIPFRNITNESDSFTVQVTDGGKLTMTGSTSMTGERLDSKTVQAKTHTLGDHVHVSGGSTFVMDEAWTGYIERRERGVVAEGIGTSVIMKSGEIRDNDGIRQVLAASGAVSKKGGGISLEDRASFVMDGGSIRKNQTGIHGGGVYVGTNCTFTMNQGRITENRAGYVGSGVRHDGWGGGIYSGDGTRVQIGTANGTVEDTVISMNTSTSDGGLYGGGGIAAHSSLKIQNAKVSGNSSVANGGGIYVAGADGRLEMEGCVVDNNQSKMEGGGIYLYGNGTDMSIKNSSVFGNFSSSTSVSTANGGGIAVLGSQNLIIEDSDIYSNGASKSGSYSNGGGGIFISGVVANKGRPEVTLRRTRIYQNSAAEGASTAEGYGGGVLLRLGAVLHIENGVEIKDNTADYGGGIAAVCTVNDFASSSIHMQGGEITLNSATTNGGGIYSGYGKSAPSTSYPANWYGKETQIKENTAGAQGGGIYLKHGKMYLSDMKIQGNHAQSGGAIATYEAWGNARAGEIYLSETTEGSFQITDNAASLYGGGIYCDGDVAATSGTTVHVDIAGPIKNTANVQGSNIYYIRNCDLYLLKGGFQQAAASTAGTYNVFINNAGGRRIFMDPASVTVEKKTEANPEAIYFNSGNSYLTYLAAPSSDAYKTMPIDLNSDEFKVGSVVIKPANLSKVTSSRPVANVSAAETYDHNYTALKTAVTNIGYSSGGILPRRTQLGGFEDSNDPSLVNAVVLGEGVYLKSAGDDVNNNGTSPTDAVATFEKAKEILERRIRESAADPGDTDGFSPYIYICGNVLVDRHAVWELPYDESLYKETNAAYKITEMAAGADEASCLAQVRRFTSFVKQPMITVGSSDTDAVSLTVGKLIINGMADGVILSDQGEHSPVMEIKKASDVTLQGEAQITNNYHNGINVAGRLILTGNQSENNKQLKDIQGTAVILKGDGGSIEMNGHSRILIEGGSAISNVPSTGISVTGNNNRVHMRDQSKIERKATAKIPVLYGIHVQGNAASIDMEGNAVITGINGSSTTASTVSSTDDGIGIYVQKGENCSINMNMNDDATELDSAKIAGLGNKKGTGIRIGSGSSSDPVYTCQVQMGQFAAIEGWNYGIHSGFKHNIIKMQGNSRILRNNSAGIVYRGSVDHNHEISMSDSSMIAGNTGYGIQQGGGQGQLTLEMAGNAHISANKIGVDLGNTGSSSKRKIVMSGSAVIGGTTDYASNNLYSGNQETGISAAPNLELTMSGSSAIKYNRRYGILGHVIANARYDAAKIVMEDTSSITNNGWSGIQIGSSPSGDARGSSWEISLTGQATIAMNLRGVVTGSETILRLKDSSMIYRTDPNSHSEDISIDSYGQLELDGSSTVKGRIYLRRGSQPITMTSTVTDPLKEYHLWLSDAYVGKVVVQPDNVGVSDVTNQLAYFRKVDGEDLAADKSLIPMAPNIVLDRENNVFISSSGQDTNDGSSPSTAVRTFKRAKELLQTGHFREGANILVCGNVKILNTDTDWSFDSDGMVRNESSGARWKPLVKRYKNLSANTMLTVDTDITVVFRNITIDGGAEDGIFVNHVSSGLSGRGSGILDVGSRTTRYKRDSKVTLGSGAVLQNNHYQPGSTNYRNTDCYAFGVTVMANGTLEIDGGTIQGITVEYDSTSNATKIVPTAVSAYADTLGQKSAPKITFKSGKIAGNRVIPSQKSGQNGSKPDIAAAVLIGKNAILEMSGGVIEDNVTGGQYNPLRDTETLQEVAGGAGLAVWSNGIAQISGGIIRNNEGQRGSGIHYFDDNSVYNGGGVILSGGVVEGNTSDSNPNAEAVGGYAPIFVNGSNFQLQGGEADLKDQIYLTSTEHVVKVSGNIYQSDRKYQISLNQATATSLGSEDLMFKKGSVVVEPDGNWMTDVTAFLNNFEVRANPYVLEPGRTSQPGGTVDGVKENQCLILMKAVYLDSVQGKDGNDGTKPSKAVRTFTQAKAEGQSGYGGRDYYIIYISGKAVNTAAETEWSLEAPAYLCRYTGFPVYEEDGRETPETEHAYRGYLIEPAFDLTFKNIAVYGRRVIDTIISNGDSLVNVKPGVKVTVQSGAGQSTAFERNYNVGQYHDPVMGLPKPLSGKGGAFHVEPDGILQMEGGTIVNTEAAYGGAVYLDADENSGVTGHLQLTGNPSISGKVHLDGKDTVIAAYVEPDAGYVPAAPLEISVGNPYNGREIVKYTDGNVPGYGQIQHYRLDDTVNSIYDMANRAGEASTLELSQRRAIYLDGKNGDDANDGRTPETAFKTLRKVYESIGTGEDQKGTMVFVVDTVELSASTEQDVVLTNTLIRDGEISYYEGSYQDAATAQPIPIRGQIYLKRYAQPSGYRDGDSIYAGFGKPTHKGELFHIGNGGNLTLRGVYLDGHSRESRSGDATLEAAAVEAQAPLITVTEGGRVTADLTDTANKPPNGVDTVTVLMNNHNITQKTNVIGQLDGSNIIEGTGSGIELLGGTAILESTEFRNLTLGENVISGGTDVYSNGELHISYRVLFSGSVFLEGMGTRLDTASQDTSRYVTVDAYGTPVLTDFYLLMRDPYAGRKVVSYPAEGSGLTSGPADTQIASYRLEQQVKDYFYLVKRSGAPYILELQIPPMVYIDGMNGNDDVDNRNAGSTPSNPVKTLERAFELLKDRAGHSIYVVNTIQVDESVDITGTSYRTGSREILLGSTDKVQFIRYIQPDFAYGNDTDQAVIGAGYHVADFTGPLMNVKGGVNAQFSSNVFFDGHSQTKEGEAYAKEATVTRTSEAKGALITVEQGGTLNLLTGVTLKDNNNTYQAGDAEGSDGGVVYNSGTTVVNGALFTNNQALKGSAAYQDGIFTIQTNPENLSGHSFYLTSTNTGTADAPIWEDHVIQLAVMMPDDQTFDVDMDHAVPGRDVVRFTTSSAYTPDADAEHNHFILGSTVPETLFLVQDPSDEQVLELQNWEILDVEVPSDIYLVVHQTRKSDRKGELQGIILDAPGTHLMSAPDYKITNRGRYDVKVSVSGFENQTSQAGISHEEMVLTDSAAAAVGEKDLYLAIKGLDSNAANGFTMGETPLKAYEQNPAAAPALMGTLTAGGSGRFTFVGSVGEGFISKYMDTEFPIQGTTRTEVQAHMDGTSPSGQINARAKYALKYKLDIVPSRR